MVVLGHLGQPVKEQNGDLEVASVTGSDGKMYGVPYTDNTWFMSEAKSKRDEAARLVDQESAKRTEVRLKAQQARFMLYGDAGDGRHCHLNIYSVKYWAR